MADVKVPKLLHKMSSAAQKAWYKKHGMEMPAKERSAAQAKRIKAEPPKKAEPIANSSGDKPKTTREINAERQKAYYAKGGRKPIGAGGSGGHSSMAGSNMSTVKGVIAGIKAGVNPKVSLDPYESERAKKTGPRSLKLKKESVDEALSPERKRMFNLKLQLIKKAANRKDRAKPSKVHEPRTSLNPAADMKLMPKSVNSPHGYYKEEIQLEEASPMIKPPTSNIFYKKSEAFAHADKHGGKVYRRTFTHSNGQQTVSYTVKKEEVELDEVTKQEAEKVLGGEVKEKPKMAPGKQPAGYRYVRGLARKALKSGIKKRDSESVIHKAMEKEMTKMGEEVEQIVEQDDSMEKKEMAQTQLHFIGYAAKEILEFIDMGGEIEEWYQNKLSKVQSEVESLHSYIEGEKRRTGMVKEENEITEKAPPGSKYERMVKHIKAGYAKGGLTPKEKSIAYATAWKAYKKNEEVEQVTEAEGSIPTTPKEKELAAHHGDPKKITYGDVIKARLKSAAAKKMGK